MPGRASWPAVLQIQDYDLSFAIRSRVSLRGKLLNLPRRPMFIVGPSTGGWGVMADGRFRKLVIEAPRSRGICNRLWSRESGVSLQTRRCHGEPDSLRSRVTDFNTFVEAIRLRAIQYKRPFNFKQIPARFCTDLRLDSCQTNWFKIFVLETFKKMRYRTHYLFSHTARRAASWLPKYKDENSYFI